MPDDRHAFASTHWSVVLEAAREDSPGAAVALERLCRDYWYPLYAFLRRRGHSPAEAEDLTQTFFAERVVTRRVFREVHPSGGRFRSWLLTCLRNLVVNDWEQRRAERRGGGARHLPLDVRDAEDRYLSEPATTGAPEHHYDRDWAFTVIRRTLSRMAEEHAARDQSEVFSRLQAFLPGSGEPPSYEEVARHLDRSVDAVKMAVSRLRRDFRGQLRAELTRTVASPEQVEEELKYLREILSP